MTKYYKNKMPLSIWIATLTILVMTSLPVSAATLKTTSRINSNIITVGDIFEDTGIFASRYLAPAPASGQVKVLNTIDLQRIAKAFDLDWQPQTGHEQLLIRRTNNSLTENIIENTLRQEIGKRLSKQKFDMEIDTSLSGLNLPAEAEKTLSVRHLDLDLKNGTFMAKIIAPKDNPVIKQTIAGRIETLTTVPVLNTTLRSGDIIRAGDISYIEIYTKKLPVKTILDETALIGQTPRRGIAPMRLITDSEITAPKLVNKGEKVTVILKNGALNLTLQARAIDSGAKGETIRIINTETNRQMDAKVSGPQTVNIILPTTQL